ncbi:MAG: ABC transporter ATP-binding protein, partial [Candidatus Gerdarchaeota archaeon]
MSVVSLKNITYSVEDKHSKELISILEDVNLQVAVGEFHLITGPSGSGKTTLLQIIATILQPTAGELTLFKRNVTRNN